MPKISVIAPVYKVEPYLERCVDSLLEQTFSDFELILVDDGSPDGCPEICDAYAEKDSRVIVIHQENGGFSSARNAGIDWAFEHSDSRYISFIDSDDWVHRQYLETLYNAIKTSNAGASIVMKEDFNDGMEPTTVVFNAETYVIDNRTACHRIDYGKDGFGYAVVWGKLYRKELWENIRFPYGRIYEDAFTTHRVLYSAKTVAIVEATIYYYRVREDGFCRSGYYAKRLDRIYGYAARAEFYREHNEKELYLETVILILSGARGDYYRCINEINDAEAAKKCRKIFNEYFDKERKYIKAKEYCDFWRFRYKTYDKLWPIISICYRIDRSLKVNGICGSIKKCEKKIYRRLSKKTGCRDKRHE